MAQQGLVPSTLTVNRDDELPVGVQLAWRLRGMIGSGELAPGARLPSVRGLAELAGVHVNTVRSVYGQLERDGLIASRQGRGTFVSERPSGSPEIQRIATEAVSEAVDAGIDPRRLSEAVYAATGAALPDLEREGDQHAARRDLRRQIGHLEAELAAYARELPRPEPQHPLLAPKAHVADVAELEEIRDRLLEQLAGARATAARRGRRADRARARREQMVRDPGDRRWEWVSNEEAGEQACGGWHVTPQYGPLGAVMGWWRVKVSSGCP
jgi:DNA-binding transcriptional regulator YhcF (GntR family)